MPGERCVLSLYMENSGEVDAAEPGHPQPVTQAFCQSPNLIERTVITSTGLSSQTPLNNLSHRLNRPSILYLLKAASGFYLFQQSSQIKVVFSSVISCFILQVFLLTDSLPFFVFLCLSFPVHLHFYVLISLSVFKPLTLCPFSWFTSRVFLSAILPAPPELHPGLYNIQFCLISLSRSLHWFLGSVQTSCLCLNVRRDVTDWWNSPAVMLGQCGPIKGFSHCYASSDYHECLQEQHTHTHTHSSYLQQCFQAR